MAAKRGGLGRGLDALFADAAPIAEENFRDDSLVQSDAPDEKKNDAKDEGKTAVKKKIGNEKPVRESKTSVSETTTHKNTAAKASNADDYEDRIIYIDINDIRPNVDQPRKNFNEEKLQELAASLKENGVIQPLIVREKEIGYELVAGERRWRASRIAGIKKVPCIIRNFDEKQNAIVAIIENMQREDLDPIEEAAGLLAMTKKYGFTQEQISTSLGKSRAYIANSMRLLRLPESIRDNITNGVLSAAHGRTLLGIDDEEKQLELANRIIDGGLSVRATEKLVDKAKDDAKPNRKKRKSNKPEKPEEIVAVENELKTITGTKVNIVGTRKMGKIELEYYSLEELNRLIEALRTAF